MSCSCDRSLENGMKSTTLRRALDFLEPASRKREHFRGVDEVGEGAVAAEELLVGAALCDLSVSQDQDEVGLWQEAHPDSFWSDDFVKDVLAHVSVHGRQRVVHEPVAAAAAAGGVVRTKHLGLHNSARLAAGLPSRRAGGPIIVVRDCHFRASDSPPLSGPCSSPGEQRAVDFSLEGLPEHLGDGEHEGVVEYDAQGTGQKVKAELARQCPEQEEAGALLLLQLPEELRLVWQPFPKRHARRQGLLLPARAGEYTQVTDEPSGSEMLPNTMLLRGAFQVFHGPQVLRCQRVTLTKTWAGEEEKKGGGRRGGHTEEERPMGASTASDCGFCPLILFTTNRGLDGFPLRSLVSKTAQKELSQLDCEVGEEGEDVEELHKAEGGQKETQHLGEEGGKNE
ncbi:hypothetical protein EYF80_044264 [Liparis tanakae]|uniref:Uncharacterized protein n=1 Tax=Liparis tanakae TaxID=230148 RepID=A0A4Z2FW96_9TELE|nr:hypothetical protein EYF80_044264 [Liparis tanakae]